VEADPAIERASRAGVYLWGTAGLPDGMYTLRIVLEDKKRGELSRTSS
jgi:hypothetical protein